MAREACGVLDRGTSKDELSLIVAANAVDMGLEDDVAVFGTITGAGIPAFCPEHN